MKVVSGAKVPRVRKFHGTKVLGLFAPRERMFHGTKVQRERKFYLWSFRSQELKCKETKRPVTINSVHYLIYRYSSTVQHYRKTLPPDVFKFGPLPNAYITLDYHCH